ncbi:CDGSH iron-sulfur domain-containing protein [Mycobacterium interjectum]|uniref:CDGSH iron-sulfur domain-containing protein n=1 Tax=Mycobacterium interjectum TaxID=33895 RepID=UPI000A01852C|nr:CDGSH iron-sulfur domain-containing protein [Mycobacterium interjectum]MCV7090879.1 CDGSH iron-sulfur domain-containing protein [Mycobacterium interjectum]
MTTTRVQVVPGGPVLVSGPVSIEMPDGEVVESDRFMVAICTCRRSDAYPLCDTSHRRCRRAGRRTGRAATANPGAAATTSDPAATTP